MPKPLQVNIQVDGLEDAIKAAERVGVSAERVLMAALDAAAEVIQDEIKSYAPGPEIEREPVTESTAVDIGPDKEHWYYRFAETGAAPHEIKPSVARALFFNDRFAARVQHPGFAARPFMRPVADNPPGEAGQKASAVLKRGIES